MHHFQNMKFLLSFQNFDESRFKKNQELKLLTMHQVLKLVVPIIFSDFQEVEINGKKYFQQSIINKQSWQTTHYFVPFQPSGHDRKERQYFCRKVWILIGVTWYWKSATYQSGLFLQHHCARTSYYSSRSSEYWL